MLRVDVAGEELWLSAERCIWWPARRTLIVADLHFGKAASFRALGVPVPEKTTDQDLARLAHLIATTGAGRVVLLGDLLHARHGRSAELMDAVGAWRARHAGVEMLLVRGNHDRRLAVLTRQLDSFEGVESSLRHPVADGIGGGLQDVSNLDIRPSWSKCRMNEPGDSCRVGAGHAGAEVAGVAGAQHRRIDFVLEA